MKIAIPVFHTKISPRFDGSQGFVLLEIEKNSVIVREELLTEGWTPAAKIRQLVRLGIDGLICGGIDRASMQCLSFNGIKVYSWVTGEVEDAVSCFLNNGLESRIMLGAQGTRTGRWRFKAQRELFHTYSQRGVKDFAREVITMPRGDGKGPQGDGPRSSKRKGCKNGKGGRGSGQGEGRRRGRNQPQSRGQGLKSEK